MKPITLHASCLESKFGFGDGDILNEVIWKISCERSGTEFIEESIIDHHEVLIALVRKYLIPAIGRPVETFTWGTCHNPIRLEDGEELVNGEENVSVAITYEQILETIKELEKLK